MPTPQTSSANKSPVQADPGAQIPFSYDIRFPDSEPSPAVRFQIEELLLKLSHLSDRIVDCRVSVAIPHKRGKRIFHVGIQLDVPGTRLVVSREPEQRDEHGDVHTAVTDAFHKITRQLEDFLRARQQQKTHAGA